MQVYKAILVFENIYIVLDGQKPSNLFSWLVYI